MPSHVAKFKWRTAKREWTDYETVETEHGTFKNGGFITERRSASRGGIHVATVEGTWRIPSFSEPGPVQTDGTWVILRPDGSIYQQGQIEGTWGIPKPSDDVLEEIAAGA